MCAFKLFAACVPWGRPWAQYGAALDAPASPVASNAVPEPGSYLVAFASVAARDAVLAALSARVDAAAVAAAAGTLVSEFAASVTAEYANAFPGFALRASDSVVEFLAGRAEVVGLMQDVRFALDPPFFAGAAGGGDASQGATSGPGRVLRLGAVARRVQSSTLPWGLDRIDQARLPL